MRILPLALLLLLAACGGTMPQIRPLPATQSAETTPFASAYESGKSHLRADRLGLAIIMFEKALSYDPLSVAALNAIAACYDELHRPDVARTYYRKAFALAPDSADTINNMAVSAAMAGDQTTALRLFARAASLDPVNATIRDNTQMARMSTPPDLATLPEGAAEANRPQLERTGLAEVTLTLPPGTVETRPLAPPNAGAAGTGARDKAEIRAKFEERAL